MNTWQCFNKEVLHAMTTSVIKNISKQKLQRAVHRVWMRVIQAQYKVTSTHSYLVLNIVQTK